MGDLKCLEKEMGNGFVLEISIDNLMKVVISLGMFLVVGMVYL